MHHICYPWVKTTPIRSCSTHSHVCVSYHEQKGGLVLGPLGFVDLLLLAGSSGVKFSADEESTKMIDEAVILKQDHS